jgi:hypothetical protein
MREFRTQLSNKQLRHFVRVSSEIRTFNTHPEVRPTVLRCVAQGKIRPWLVRARASY